MPRSLVVIMMIWIPFVAMEVTVALSLPVIMHNLPAMEQHFLASE